MRLLRQARGFAHWLILLLIILLLAVGFAGWKVWQHKDSSTAKAKKSSSHKTGSTKSALERATPPSNSFSVDLPNGWVKKACSDVPELLFLAPNESLLGHCNSESAGMVSISRTDGDQRESQAAYEADAFFDNITFTTTTIDSLPGYKLSYTIGDSGEIGYPPNGTTSQQYFLYDADADKTYVLTYQQFAGNPDHAATFTAIAESFSRE